MSKSACPEVFLRESLDISTLQQLAQTQIEQLKLVKSQHWQDFFFDSLKSNHPLDLGPQTRQVLLKNKTFAYRDVLQPFENELEG